MKCTKCGAEVAKGSRFCEFCGNKIPGNTKKSKVIACVVFGLLAVSGLFFLPILSIVPLAYAIWQRWFHLANQPFEIADRNSDWPKSLTRISGIGYAFLGKYRKLDDGSYVTYLFFWFILPICPVGCYRVKRLKPSWLDWNLSYEVYGSDKRKTAEIVNVYLIFYGLLLFVGFLVALAISLIC